MQQEKNFSFAKDHHSAYNLSCTVRNVTFFILLGAGLKFL
jgi:hypothetical protein